MHFGSQKYTSNSNNCCLDYLVIHLGVAVGTTLSADKLENTAKRLVHEWPILGGKISMKSIPFSFTCGDNVDFKSRTLDQSLNTVIQHPNPTTKSDGIPQPMLLGGSAKEIDGGFLFNTWSLGRSNFAIRVTLLQDATLLNFTMPHSVVDARSLFEVVCAFCAMLKNDPIHKIQLSPDVRGIQMSSLVGDGVQDEKQPVNSGSQASYNDHRQTWRPNLYSISRVCGKNFKTAFLSSRLGSSRVQDALICIPQQWLDTAREECMRERDLDESLSNATTQLSKNDTIIAWLLKLLYGHESQSEPIDLFCPLDIHGFTKQEETEAPYLHNDFSTLRCHFTAAELKKSPKHWIANRVRSTLLSYKNTSSARDYWRFLEDSASKIKMPNSTGQSVYITSWAAFDFAKLDFSGANAHDDDNMSSPSPSVLFLCPKISPRLLSAVDGFFVSWKDANRDSWIRGCMSVDVIRKLDVL